MEDTSKYLFVGGLYHSHALTVTGNKAEISLPADNGRDSRYYMHDLISHCAAYGKYLRVPVFVHQDTPREYVVDFVATVLNGSQSIKPAGAMFTAYMQGDDLRWNHINMSPI